MSTARMKKIVNEYCDRDKLLKMLEEDYQERTPDFDLNNKFALASKVYKIVRTTDASTQESATSNRHKHEKKD